MSNILANSPAEVIRAVLIGLGLGSDPSSWSAGAGSPWPVLVEGEPNVPDNLIVVTDTTGQDDGRAMFDGELFTHYGFQVKVRSADHPTGWLRADLIRQQMAQDVYGLAVVIDSSTYLVWAITHIGNVLPLGKDVGSSKRSLFSINAMAPIRQLS